MKRINNVNHYYRILTTEPYVLFVFTSKSCGPCQDLKHWLEETHPEDMEHVYFIDVEQSNLKVITQSIYALPTINFQHFTETLEQQEGFCRIALSEMLAQARTKRILLANLQSLDGPSITLIDSLESHEVLEPRGSPASPASPASPVEHVDTVPMSIDEILKAVEESIQETEQQLEMVCDAESGICRLIDRPSKKAGNDKF